MKRQREAFLEGTLSSVPPLTHLQCAVIDLVLSGTPAPDFPSGVGESEHLGRLTPDFIMRNINIDAQRAMGLAKYDQDRRDLPKEDRQMLQRANKILGFV